MSVAGRRHDAGRQVARHRGALVKDLGTIYQQDLPEIARALVESEATTEEDMADFLDVAPVRDHDGAQLHHPGRHDAGAPRHRRARAGVAMMLLLTPLRRRKTPTPPPQTGEGNESSSCLPHLPLPRLRGGARVIAGGGGVTHHGS
jgi:hypothetical protein